jgi:hypothetical protein
MKTAGISASKKEPPFVNSDNAAVQDFEAAHPELFH